MTRPLTAALAADSTVLRKRIGTVVTSSPLVVEAGNGSQIPITAVLSSYSPSPGATVLILTDGQGMAVLLGGVSAP